MNIFWKSYYSQPTKETLGTRIYYGVLNILLAIFVYGLLIVVLELNGSTFTFSTKTFVVTKLNLLDSNKVMYDQTKMDNYIYPKLPIYLKILSPFVFLASIAFSIFAAVGLGTLPLELILKYLNAPKSVDPKNQAEVEELVFRKRVLRERSQDLINRAKEIFDRQKEMTIDSSKSAVQMKNRRNMYELQTMALKRQTEDFEEMMDIVRVEEGTKEFSELDNILLLVGGCITSCLCIVFIIHLFFVFCGQYTILDNLLMYTVKLNVNLGLGLYLAIAIFFSMITNFGYLKFSQLMYPHLKVHKFRPNATWTDSFLVYNSILMVSQVGVTVHLCKFCPIFFSHTHSAFLFGKIFSRVSLYKFFYDAKLFEIMLFMILLLVFTVSFYLPNTYTNLKKLAKNERLRIKAEKKKLEEMQKD